MALTHWDRVSVSGQMIPYARMLLWLHKPERGCLADCSRLQGEPIISRFPPAFRSGIAWS